MSLQAITTTFRMKNLMAEDAEVGRFRESTRVDLAAVEARVPVDGAAILIARVGDLLPVVENNEIARRNTPRVDLGEENVFQGGMGTDGLSLPNEDSRWSDGVRVATGGPSAVMAAAYHEPRHEGRQGEGQYQLHTWRHLFVAHAASLPQTLSERNAPRAQSHKRGRK